MIILDDSMNTSSTNDQMCSQVNNPNVTSTTAPPTSPSSSSGTTPSGPQSYPCKRDVLILIDTSRSVGYLANFGNVSVLLIANQACYFGCNSNSMIVIFIVSYMQLLYIPNQRGDKNCSKLGKKGNVVIQLVTRFIFNTVLSQKNN